MKKNTTHNLTVAAMLSAVAFILMFIEFPLPMLIPSFVKMDFSDLPALLGAFALGPVYGVVISFMKNLLHIIIKGTSTACVGELCNFMLGAVFSAVAGWMLAALGQFCSALYWRLNKFWTILISVTVPLVLIFGSVPLISWLGTTSAGRAAVEALAAFGRFLAASPWNMAAVLLAMGAAFFTVTWLLLRRAMIRPAK